MEYNPGYPNISKIIVKSHEHLVMNNSELTQLERPGPRGEGACVWGGGGINRAITPH